MPVSKNIFHRVFGFDMLSSVSIAVHMLPELFLCSIYTFIRILSAPFPSWFYSSRIEARTKDFNICGSARVSNLNAPWKWLLGFVHRQPANQLREAWVWAYVEDPKDVELCFRRLKSGETLTEARSGTVVHIVCQTHLRIFLTSGGETTDMYAYSMCLHKAIRCHAESEHPMSKLRIFTHIQYYI